MQKTINHIYSLRRPTGPGTTPALVIDLPHAGTCVPFSQGCGLVRVDDQGTWDGFADQLWEAAPQFGAALLSARFPSTFIDADQAPELLRAAWAARATPQGTTAGVWRAEFEMRLGQYHQAYHRMLDELLGQAHQRLGIVWHINCCGMPARNPGGDVKSGSILPDIVISDCHGQSADPVFTEWAAEELEQLGYRVVINAPSHSGGYVVQHHGRAREMRNSIRLELNRDLYMNARLREKNAGFERLQTDLQSFLRSASGHIEAQLARETV